MDKTEISKRHPLTGRKVLITGGLGMIGSNLTQELVALGAEITILDAQLPQYGGNPVNLEGVQDQVKIEYGDIRDKEMLDGLVQGKDLIYSLAGQVSYIDSNIDPFLDLDINCRGHLNILEACRNNNQEARIVFASSRMVYGKIQYLPVNEEHPVNPLSIYGVHKLTDEKYNFYYHRVHGLDTVSVRLANPYGIRSQMRHPRYGIVNWFIRLAMDNEPITVFGEGNQIRDYIHVGDIVKALVACGEKPGAAGRVINLGSGQPMTLYNMAQTVCRVVGSGEVRKIPWPDNYERIETGDYYFDVSLAKEILGWEPQLGIEEGIAQTVDYYRRHKSKYW